MSLPEGTPEGSTRREQRLAAPKASATAVPDGEDRGATLRTIVRQARLTTGAAAAAIALPTPEQPSTLTFEVVDAVEDPAPLIGLVMPVAGTTTGQAFSTARPVAVQAYGERVARQHAGSSTAPAGMIKDLDEAISVPLVADGKCLGALTVTRLEGAPAFSESDIELVESFAHHATLVLELTHARDDSRRLAILEDRSRIARNLHDVVIQGLYALGLRLYVLSEEITERDTAKRANQLVDDLDHAILNIRASIFALEEPGPVQGNTRSQLWHLIHGFTDILGFEPWVDLQGPIDAALPASVRPDLDAALCEALSNVIRHASATSVYVGVSVDGHGSQLELTVVDNGNGIQNGTPRLTSGLANLEARAKSLAGTFSMDSEPGHGTKLVWRVALPGPAGQDAPARGWRP